MSISKANHPTEQIVPQQQHQLPLKRQSPFSSMKPPFGDYHQFSSPALDLRLKEPEAIVVKSPKSEKVDLIAKSSDWNPSTGYVEAVGSPLQTPVSGKGEKAQKAPRMAKSNGSGSQTPVSNVVTLSVELGKPVADPMYQQTPRPSFSEAMESCPKADIPNLKDLLKEENVHLITEAYASRGYIAIAINSRYHGERASSMTTYRDALVSSWKQGDTMPFIFDTVWDLIKLADYLTQREDIDLSKIGITSESLGGMHAWFAAAVDTRYAVAIPIIRVQGFQWAIDHDKWHGRVDSIKVVFEEAWIHLGKSAIDKEVVEQVWIRIAPGLASKFDSPYSIPIIAPRPLLILNGEKDPRCPIEGLEIPKSRACKAYEDAHCPDNFKVIAQPGIGHEMTPLMVKEASDWFDTFLNSNPTRSVDLGHPDCAGVILCAAERATQVALQAIQCLGGNGYVNEYPTGRLLRDAKLYEIGAGTSEIRRLIIGRELFKEQ